MVYLILYINLFFSPYHKVLALMWLSMNVMMVHILEALMTSFHNLQDLLSLAMALLDEHLYPTSLFAVLNGPNQVFQNFLNLMKMNLMDSDHILQDITGIKPLVLKLVEIIKILVHTVKKTTCQHCKDRLVDPVQKIITVYSQNHMKTNSMGKMQDY